MKRDGLSNRRTLLLGGALAVTGAIGFLPRAGGAEAAVAVPAPDIDLPAAATDTVVLGGGCFWGVQGVFQHVKGVKSALSGYAGGAASTARYDDVGTGRTGHAEVVQVEYDPTQVSFGQLLQIWFSVAHDPTQLDRQGPDRGPQYRSAVFPQNERQAQVARAYIAQLNRANTFGKPLATTVETGHRFHAAEAYHQDYLTLHPNEMYIVVHDLPKVDRLRKQFPALFNTRPVLVGTAR